MTLTLQIGYTIFSVLYTKIPKIQFTSTKMLNNFTKLWMTKGMNVTFGNSTWSHKTGETQINRDLLLMLQISRASIVNMNMQVCVGRNRQQNVDYIHYKA